MKYLYSFIILFSILVNPINTFAEEVVLAGGCFWCLEHDLESLKGVNTVISGYSGGDLQNPTYENHNGHQEVVLVDYDSEVVSLSEIYRLYMRNIDPLDGGGQFCDRGNSYRPVIFYENSNEKREATKSLLSASKELGTKLDKISVRQFYDNLSKIGYTIKKTINIKNKRFNNNVVKAFQRRFRQELVNGKLDKECLIISNNLVKHLN